jgi:Cu+-exporting ATPase
MDHSHTHEGHNHKEEKQLKDPVCAMDVSPASAEHTAHYHDHDYYFCSSGCQTKFTAHPEQYISA